MSVYNYTIELEDFNNPEMKALEQFLKMNAIPYRKIREEEEVI